MSQGAPLSPKDLSPESIAEWLAQAEQIMAQFSSGTTQAGSKAVTSQAVTSQDG
jgi:hypothetical protein